MNNQSVWLIKEGEHYVSENGKTDYYIFSKLNSTLIILVGKVADKGEELIVDVENYALFAMGLANNFMMEVPGMKLTPKGNDMAALQKLCYELTQSFNKGDTSAVKTQDKKVRAVVVSMIRQEAKNYKPK